MTNGPKLSVELAPQNALCAFCFDCHGMVARIDIPEGRSVTGIFYRDSVLSAVLSHYTAARPCIGVRRIKILHDKAMPNRNSVKRPRARRFKSPQSKKNNKFCC